MPAISVIVPVFRTEQYVEQCIKSILHQTFQDFEILCIDDASPDDSLPIIESLAERDDRIKIIRHQSNMGLGAARNTGIKQARAEYVGGVDSDDYVMPEFLAQLHAGTDGGMTDIVVCGIECLASSNGVLTRSLLDTTVNVVDPLSTQNNIFGMTTPSFCNKLWRRNLFIDNDICFPTDIYYEDLATTPRVLSFARRVRYTGGKCYKYVLRNDTIIGGYSLKHLIDYFKVFDILKDFCVSNNIYEERKAQMRQQLLNHLEFHTRNVLDKVQGHNADSINQYLYRLVEARTAFLVGAPIGQIEDIIIKSSQRESFPGAA